MQKLKEYTYVVLIPGFTHFMMFSDHQDILDQSKVRLIYQNMDQPLSEFKNYAVKKEGGLSTK